MSAEPEPKRGAQPGNRNAAAGEEDLDAVLHIRCTTAEKNAFTRKAQEADMKLARWIRVTLAKEAGL